MNHIHKKRMMIILFFAVVMTCAISLILYALNQNLNIFYTPKQLTETKMKPNLFFRLGGVVKPDSLKHGEGLAIKFLITDYKKEIMTYYTGVVPDLFKEGKGVVASGYLNLNGEFIAQEILAKHNENYMPKNVYQALRASS